MDKEIQSQLYDPKKRRSAWLSFVLKHKHIKLPNGRINLKAISKLWTGKSRKQKRIDGYIKEKNRLVKKVLEAREKYSKAKRGSEKDRALVLLKYYENQLSAAYRVLRGMGVDIRRTYDPHRLIETKEEGGREIPESHDHYHKNIKIYDPKLKAHGINRPPKRWFYAMLQGIKKRSDVRNPAAIVGSIWKRLSPTKKAEIKRRELQGKPFKYDLPLPDDRDTHGTGTLRMVKPFKLAEVQVNLSVKDYLAALKSGLFQRMKRGDGSTALVARCKSDKKNCNIFVDKV